MHTPLFSHGALYFHETLGRSIRDEPHTFDTTRLALHTRAPPREVRGQHTGSTGRHGGMAGAKARGMARADK